MILPSFCCFLLLLLFEVLFDALCFDSKNLKNENKIALGKYKNLFIILFIHSAALSPDDQQRKIYFLSHTVYYILYPAPEEICYFTSRAKQSNLKI